MIVPLVVAPLDSSMRRGMADRERSMVVGSASRDRRLPASRG